MKGAISYNYFYLFQVKLMGAIECIAMRCDAMSEIST
jgi:hypothetical protein